MLCGFIFEFLPDEKIYPYAHEIGYAIWITCYTYWLAMMLKKQRLRHVSWDESALKDHHIFEIHEDLNIEYFAVDESNHTSVNWWRKMRGKLTVKLFKGTHPGGGIIHDSHTIYAVTKKQLFEMRLRGYCENASPEIAMAALKDEWLQKFRCWIK